MKRPWVKAAENYLEATREVLTETFWPTRCALCDRAGTLLCDECRLYLPYIDHWRRCTHCGAAYGNIQCSECNPVMLAGLGMKKLPFKACVSVIDFEGLGARLITTYKDKNEQGLAVDLAAMLGAVIPPAWFIACPGIQLSYIPASIKAYRRRGFDHAERLTQEVSQKLGIPYTCLLERPQSLDQRFLSRQERIINMEKRFRLKGGKLPNSVLLIDDVYTTGATLSFATKELIAAGVDTVYCATFARV